MASKERFKYENGEVDKYEDAQNNNLHKYLCRGKDVMTIYSLLAIYTWVLIEGNVSFTVCLKMCDITHFCIDLVDCHASFAKSSTSSETYCKSIEPPSFDTDKK